MAVNMDGLAEQFESHRKRLLAKAFRMLGSLGAAEDAVQECWLRLSRADGPAVDNLGGWLTTVVSRICLDMLRSQKARREESLDMRFADEAAFPEGGADPEREVMLADSVGVALLVVLGNLNPTERIAFILHDIFAVPYAEIAAIIGKTEAATRQLASRARRRVQGKEMLPAADRSRQREVVDAFLAAARAGDFDRLVAAFHSDVELRDDRQPEGRQVTKGAHKLAGQIAGKAQAAQSALVDGAAGAVVAPGGKLLYVISFSIRDGKITEVELISDPLRIRRLDVKLYPDASMRTQAAKDAPAVE